MNRRYTTRIANKRIVRSMLLRFVLVASVLISAAFVLLLTVIRAQPYDDRGAALLLDLDAGCAVPCWQGIRPGETTIQEALRTLRARPWVHDLRGTPGTDLARNHPPQGRLFWDWAHPQWRQIAPGGGTLEINRGQVNAFRVVTTLSFGELWLLLGQPDYGSLRLSRAYNHEYEVHLAMYTNHGIMLRSIIPYPASQHNYWRGWVEIVIPARLQQDVPYRRPCWIGCQSS